jgi:UDP-glucose 4-epimerase
VLKRNKQKIILIGYKSFIQTHLFNHLKKKFFIKKIKFKKINKKNIESFDIIINCSNSKNFLNNKYNKKYDRNIKIANIVKLTGAKLFLLSSRQVYSQKFFLNEKSNLNPLSSYAKNCMISEKSCQKLLKNNLLILRLSNVFGFEKGKKKKPSLVSLVLEGLKRKEIVFDNNYFLYKDFLPIKLLCLYIEKLIKLNVKGVLNIGSGIPYLVKDFVDKIIDPTKVTIRVKLSKKFKDKSYSFNINKLIKLTGVKINKKKLNVYFSRLKNKLV